MQPAAVLSPGESPVQIRQPEQRALIRARVVRTERVSDHFVNITLGGDGLKGFEFLGRDQFVRLFLPREGQEELHMPTSTGNRGWYVQLLAMSRAKRPHVRNYTVRRFDADKPEMDIEFIDHGDAGPASAWATTAQPCDEVGLLTEGACYLPTEGADWQLIVADESGLPAVASILEQAPDDLRAEVYLEVPAKADVRELSAPEGVTVHWLPREDTRAVPGRLALETVRAAELPEGRPYCFLVGEKDLPTGLRRHLVREHGVAKADIAFIGYWRHGKAAMG
ncbi:siderophore-interacting protein [Nocardiopsis sp. LOL_012]|uniref:siderophore-interacting protein n=1 Tax=Nocardiopsis sp. LOL_012 TaxID=3345409 RepID=UPI003A8A49E8